MFFSIIRYYVSFLVWYCQTSEPYVRYSCWINGTNFYGQLFFFIPLFGYFLLGSFSLFTSLRRTRNVFGNDKLRRNVLLRQTTYVLAFILMWSGPVLNRTYRLYDWATNNSACLDVCISEECTSTVSHVLTVIDSLCMAAQGFVSSVIWLSNPFFYQLVQRGHLLKIFNCATKYLCCLCRCCGCFGMVSDDPQQTSDDAMGDFDDGFQVRFFCLSPRPLFIRPVA